VNDAHINAGERSVLRSMEEQAIMRRKEDSFVEEDSVD